MQEAVSWLSRPIERSTMPYRVFFFPVGHIQFWDLTSPPLLDPCSGLSMFSDGEMAFKFTSEQERVAADIEETLLLFGQKRYVGKTLADAMPSARRHKIRG